MLSKSAEYALRAVHCLAFAPDDGPVTASDLAGRVGVPENYLSKLLHRLEGEGVVTSQRGRGGGFSLAGRRSSVSLAQVVRPFDEGIITRQCLLGRPECRDDAPCPAHDRWLEVAERVRAFFGDTTLEDLGPPAAEGCLAAEERAPRSAGVS